MQNLFHMPELSSPHFPNAFYRVTAKGLYIKDGKALLVHDFTDTGTGKPSDWELPGGGVDFGEGFHDTIRREVREEMGLTVTHIDEKPLYVWTRWHGPGRGMDWYYVLTLIFRMDLEHLNFTPTQECREIRFFSREELQQYRNELATQIEPLADVFEG